MDERAELVSRLAERFAEARVSHPLRVGIDGPCGSGKSTLARELVAAIASWGRCAVHVDSDASIISAAFVTGGDATRRAVTTRTRTTSRN